MQANRYLCEYGLNTLFMKRPEIVKRIKEALAAIAPDAKIILYGSEARGDATPQSDIDLLILLDEEEIAHEKERSIRALLYDIELDTQVLISSIIITRKSWENRPFKTPFYVNVVNEGITL